MTLPWKTELNKSISIMEDRIPRWLHHCCEMCCKKGGCHRRQACMVGRQYYYGDVISEQVDLVYDIYETFLNN